GAQTDEVDSLAPKFVASLRRRDRNGDGDRARLHFAKCGARRAPRRAVRQAILDDDHLLIANVERRPRSAVAALAANELLLLACGDGVDDARGHRHVAQHVLIEDADTAAGDGSHRQFLVSGDAELADNKYIQRRMEGLPHFGPDRTDAP